MAAGSVDDTLRLWEPIIGEELASIKKDVGDRVRGLAFSPDSQTLATAAMDGLAKLWDVRKS
ncbi:MAG: hypothetical protein NVSMB62_16850 [Acidobacteriaceae bacterium]